MDKTHSTFSRKFDLKFVHSVQVYDRMHCIITPDIQTDVKTKETENAKKINKSRPKNVYAKWANESNKYTVE